MRALLRLAVVSLVALFVTAEPRAARVDLLTSLISYWDHDDSADPGDDVHGANNLSELNTVDTVAGQISNASDFEEADIDYLYLDDNADLSFGNEDFTITAWVRAESFGGGGVDNVIVSKGTVAGSSGEYYFYWDSAGSRFEFQVYGGTGFTSGATVTANNLGAPSTATWYFLIAWLDAANDELSIRVCAAGSMGTANVTTGVTAGAHDGAGRFYIGAGYPHPGTYWDGLIDEVGLWGRELTSQEQTDLCNAGAGLAYPLSVGGSSALPAIINNPVRGGGMSYDVLRFLYYRSRR